MFALLSLEESIKGHFGPKAENFCTFVEKLKRHEYCLETNITGDSCKHTRSRKNVFEHWWCVCICTWKKVRSRNIFFVGFYVRIHWKTPKMNERMEIIHMRVQTKSGVTKQVEIKTSTSSIFLKSALQYFNLQLKNNHSDIWNFCLFLCYVSFYINLKVNKHSASEMVAHISAFASFRIIIKSILSFTVRIYWRGVRGWDEFSCFHFGWRRMQNVDLFTVFLNIFFSFIKFQISFQSIHTCSVCSFSLLVLGGTLYIQSRI